MKSYCTVVEIRRDYMCRALGLFLTHKQCVVETGQMSSAETGQMSAVETGQMSAVETRQMSTIATGRCPVLILYICLVSTADICPVSAADICPVSTADISISIHHSASAFSINNQHIMEAATAADFWLRLLAIASLGSDKIASRMRGG